MANLLRSLSQETQFGQNVVIRGDKVDVHVLPSSNPELWHEHENQRHEIHQLQWETGTPLRWTTNDPGNPAYDPLNNRGPNEWIVELDMDCSQTRDGWVAIQAGLLEHGHISWESNEIAQFDCHPGPDTPISFENAVHYAK